MGGRSRYKQVCMLMRHTSWSSLRSSPGVLSMDMLGGGRAIAIYCRWSQPYAWGGSGPTTPEALCVCRCSVPEGRGSLVISPEGEEARPPNPLHKCMHDKRTASGLTHIE